MGRWLLLTGLLFVREHKVDTVGIRLNAALSNPVGRLFLVGA
jgi:hypothetical protein